MFLVPALRAVDILTKQSLLQINVKSNFLAFKEATNSSSERRTKDSDPDSVQGINPKLTKLSLQPIVTGPQGTRWLVWFSW